MDWPPARLLNAIAGVYGDPDTAGMVAATLRPGYFVIAHMFVFEAWAQWFNPDDDQDSEERRAVVREAQDNGRSLADIPGTVESRFAVLVMGAKQFVINRTRGRRPELATTTVKDARHGFHGPLIDALISLNRASVPVGQEACQ